MNDTARDISTSTVPAAAAAVPHVEPGADRRAAFERAVDVVLDDCFIALGQVVGMRTTVDYDAVAWWRDRYRTKFLAAMMAFGDRWLQDRTNVTAVAMMLGERAVCYAEGRPSIDLQSAMQAAADVERYCHIHGRRRARTQPPAESSDGPTRMAGYWCTAG